MDFRDYKVCNELGTEIGLIDKDEYKRIKLKRYENEENKLRRIHMYQTRIKNETFIKYVDETLGKFYFNFYNRIPNIEPQYIFRFLYLCCFMNYNNDVVINRKCVTNENLETIWKLQKREKNKTKKVLLDNGLIILDAKNFVSINPKYCIKGKIKNKKGEYVRMFINGIKDLYENSSPTEHKHIQLLIELLPYVNIQHNILCHNIREKQEEKIIPLKQKEICDVLHISKPTQLKLLDIKVKGTSAFIKTSNSFVKNFYVINPLIYYKGSLPVEDLYKWCVLFNVGKQMFN